MKLQTTFWPEGASNLLKKTDRELTTHVVLKDPNAAPINIDSLKASGVFLPKSLVITNYIDCFNHFFKDLDFLERFIPVFIKNFPVQLLNRLKKGDTKFLNEIVKSIPKSCYYHYTDNNKAFSFSFKIKVCGTFDEKNKLFLEHELYAKGDNRSGQLGKGVTSSDTYPDFIPVKNINNWLNEENKKLIVNMCVGKNCAFLIVKYKDGQRHLFAAGDNRQGQLGLGRLSLNRYSLFTYVPFKFPIKNIWIEDKSAHINTNDYVRYTAGRIKERKSNNFVKNPMPTKFADLPYELTGEIFSYLRPKDVGNMFLTNRDAKSSVQNFFEKVVPNGDEVSILALCNWANTNSRIFINLIEKYKLNDPPKQGDSKFKRKYLIYFLYYSALPKYKRNKKQLRLDKAKLKEYVNHFFNFENPPDHGLSILLNEPLLAFYRKVYPHIFQEEKFKMFGKKSYDCRNEEKKVSELMLHILSVDDIMRLNSYVDFYRKKIVAIDSVSTGKDKARMKNLLESCHYTLDCVRKSFDNIQLLRNANGVVINFSSNPNGDKGHDVCIANSLLKKADFSGLLFHNFKIAGEKPIIDGCNFRNLRAMNGLGLDLGGMSWTFFSGAILKNTNFTDADLGKGDFKYAVFGKNVVFEGAKLGYSDFRNASFTEPQIFHGACFISHSRTTTSLKVNFSGTDLKKIDFSNVYKKRLYNVNFSGADLANADFRELELYNICFSGAKNLDQAKFQGAKVNLLTLRWLWINPKYIEKVNTFSFGDTNEFLPTSFKDCKNLKILELLLFRDQQKKLCKLKELMEPRTGKTVLRSVRSLLIAEEVQQKKQAEDDFLEMHKLENPEEYEW